MVAVTDLAEAQHHVRGRVAAITDTQWAEPTPCTDWSVRGLVVHLIEGSRMALRLLDGDSADDARAVFGTAHGPDLPAELDVALADELDAFERPGSLEMTVHHRVGDIPGTTFVQFRTADYVLHSWDLARATGGDEQLPDALVRTIWVAMQPMVPFIGATGQFGNGPSGSITEGAPLQSRLLDLTGRRP